MKQVAMRFVRLFCGFFVMSIGISLSYQAQLGMAPWDVLSDGVSRVLPVTFGQASIVIGLAILVIDLIARERLGFGTFLNILCIGNMVDLILWSGILTRPETLWGSLVMCVCSFPFAAMGMYLYMSAGLGAGPRDSLMVVVTRRFHYPVGLCRMCIEGVALLIGWLLGGTVGIGTVILVVGNGPIMQACFRLFRFEVGKFRNQTIPETIAMSRGKQAQPEGRDSKAA